MAEAASSYALSDRLLPRVELGDDVAETVGSLAPHGAVSPLATIVLAVLNEREALPELISELNRQALPAFEIVVVDDGSTDGTKDEIQRLARRDGRIRAVFRRVRRTLLQAQIDGLQYAGGDFVVVMDADLQHPASKVAEILSELEAGADLVIASRYAPGGSVKGRPVLRAVISRSAELLTKLCLPQSRRVSDPLSGFFGFRRSTVAVPAISRGGYKLLLPLLASLGRARVAEVPYEFQERAVGESKITGSIKFVPIFLSELLLARRAGRL